jgi:benzoate-CoA ligase family protein
MNFPLRFNAASFFVHRHGAEGRGDRVAFRHEGRSVTYAQLAADVDRVASALAGLGVEPEHRVLLAMSDSPAFAAAFWGAVKLGAVAVPVNTLMAAEDYAFILDDSRARVALVDEDVLPRFPAPRHACPSLREVIVLGQAAGGARSWNDLLDAASMPLDPAPTGPEDVMYWGYTSGSTGRPKAAVHTHANLVAAADLVGVGVFGLGPGDLVFSASKAYFPFGLGNTLYFPARVGAASLLVSERLDAGRLLEVIERERPSVFCAVPTLYARMLQVDKAYDVSSLRLCVSSGEMLPPAVFDAWKARFGLELADVMGSTEALHDFIASRPGAIRRGSIGQVVPGFEARVVDDDGRPVEAGTIGHLLIKGPTTSLYYWKRRDHTQRAMLGEWLRTGDMVSREADGYFYFAGRGDDMLKVGGQWISPVEIEARLAEHPAVLEAGVVGREDRDGLTKLCAYVALTPGGAVTEDELRGWVRAGLAGFKTPRWIEIVADLPKTATGKIQRFRLRTPP